MAIKHDKEPLKTILDKDNSKELVLPNFQRPFVWDKDDQKKLLGSILAGTFSIVFNCVIFHVF